jgi:hypothetical protein
VRTTYFLKEIRNSLLVLGNKATSSLRLRS